LALAIDMKLLVHLYPLPDDLSLNFKRCLVDVCPYCIRKVHLKKINSIGKNIEFYVACPNIFIELNVLFDKFVIGYVIFFILLIL